MPKNCNGFIIRHKPGTSRPVHLPGIDPYSLSTALGPHYLDYFVMYDVFVLLTFCGIFVLGSTLIAVIGSRALIELIAGCSTYHI